VPLGVHLKATACADGAVPIHAIAPELAKLLKESHPPSDCRDSVTNWSSTLVGQSDVTCVTFLDIVSVLRSACSDARLRSAQQCFICPGCEAKC
jgi:hypothetical protein